MQIQRKYILDITTGVSMQHSIALFKAKGMFLLPPGSEKEHYHLRGYATGELISQFEKIVMVSDWGNEPAMKATYSLLKVLEKEGVSIMGANFSSIPGEGNVYWINIHFSTERHSPDSLKKLILEGLKITNSEDIKITTF
ncbi:MAG: hypothetical protein HFJ54_07050 [Clostridia bacterium]|nr:hypothetical protein [Clostridia bacterium]